MIIYIATNILNGKSYVGKTIHSLAYRKSCHIRNINKNTTIHFQRAILKYGQSMFKWKVLWKGVCDKVWLNELEKYYIYFYDTFFNGYNMTFGGDGAESGEYNSFCRLSSIKRKETILKGNSKRRKYRATEETKKRMSETRKRMYKGRNNPMSKSYKLISPDGKNFLVEDGLENFCNKFNLSFTMIRKNLEVNFCVKKTQKNRSTSKAQNTVGWRAIECL